MNKANLIETIKFQTINIANINARKSLDPKYGKPSYLANRYINPDIPDVKKGKKYLLAATLVLPLITFVINANATKRPNAISNGM